MSPIKKSLPYYIQLYHEMKRMIYQQELPPGERVNESKLSKDLGVSRSPIREAMRLLEKDGLVIDDESAGFIVYTFKSADVKHIYQIRSALESLAVQLLIEQATTAERLEIGNLLDDIDDRIHKNDTDPKIINMNQQFHEMIAAGSQNPYLVKQLHSIKVLTYYFRVLNFEGAGRARRIQQEHRAIYEKIEGSDAAGAAYEMQKHLAQDLQHLRRVINKDDSGV
ncbi:GntR family transcriptional regulator [Geomicrobium sp. JSM 1781026]|uniref:GntR family transcriptional regulator n=1 Tax=Geomicrobium sp. JSM 1781026 TaxID=3344580 RepID=UPI0035C039E6